MSDPNAGWKRDAIRFQPWASRTELARQERQAARDASDANTVRLEALRLEKERADAEEAAANPAQTKTKPVATG